MERKEGDRSIPSRPCRTREKVTEKRDSKHNTCYDIYVFIVFLPTNEVNKIMRTREHTHTTTQYIKKTTKYMAHRNHIQYCMERKCSQLLRILYQFPLH